MEVEEEERIRKKKTEEGKGRRKNEEKSPVEEGGRGERDGRQNLPQHHVMAEKVGKALRVCDHEPW
jgi:hypothetical protein